MSEVLPPKRQAAVDRLRRRVDLYTKDHQGRYLHYDRIAPALCEQQMQESFALKQKYLDPKAKKPSKSKNTNERGGASGTGTSSGSSSAAERKPNVDIHASNTQSVSYSLLSPFLTVLILNLAPQRRHSKRLDVSLFSSEFYGKEPLRSLTGRKRPKRIHNME